MRRKDREILNIGEIFDILTRCDTVRLGLAGEPRPYVVPVSFGAEMAGGRPVVYFHCAQQGLKLDLLKRDPHVCVEADIFIKAETAGQSLTTRYESVIGFGECRILTDRDEIVHGLRLITDHYGFFDFPVEQCPSLEHLYVGKIVLDEVTGKRNLPAEVHP